MRQILHDWDDQSSLKILENIRTSMRPDSKLIVFDNVLPIEQETMPVRRHTVDLIMMTALSGKERYLLKQSSANYQFRSEKQFKDLFTKAGLKLDKVYETRGLSSLLEITKI